MPIAASNQASSFNESSAGCKPFSKRSIGNCSPITPVEKGNTWLEATPLSCANWAQVASALAMPIFPVPALALPVLITK